MKGLIIMTRTYIIDAEGTRFEAIPARTALRRRIIRRTIAGAATTITAIFLSAAIIGVNNAAHTPQGPSADDISTLHQAEKANGKGKCWLEWNFEAKGFEAICAPRAGHTAKGIAEGINITTAKKACRRAPRGSMQDCLALYLRRDWHDTRTYTPAGPALVKECISQYRGTELADCLTQEIG